MLVITKIESYEVNTDFYIHILNNETGTPLSVPDWSRSPVAYNPALLETEHIKGRRFRNDSTGKEVVIGIATAPAEKLGIMLETWETLEADLAFTRQEIIGLQETNYNLSNLLEQDRNTLDNIADMSWWNRILWAIRYNKYE